ncbi:MAG: hypothetical protein ACKOXP_00300 [Flavobacteriales bacterium]
MSIASNLIRSFLLICLFCFNSFGQEVGTMGIKAGMSIPNKLVGSLVNPGKGLVIQFNSRYFYQVRGRFSVEYYKYTPSDSAFNTFSTYSSFNSFSNFTTVIVPATLSFSKFNSLDLSTGLDYNPFKNIPEVYFGPDLFAGIDKTIYTSVVYQTPNNPTTSSDARIFFHGGLRFHLGYEKVLGKITAYTEYSISKNYSENYNPSYSSSTLNLISTTYHQFGLGIRF